MKFIPGMLVAALALPLSFAQAQTNANQSGQSGNATQQSGTTGDNRSGQHSGTSGAQSGINQGDRNGNAGAAGQQSGNATHGTDHGAGSTAGAAAGQSGADNHTAGAAGRSDRKTGASNAGTRNRTGETGDAMVSPADRRFIMEAAAGNMAEMQLAQLAQEKASDTHVKEMARMIHDDHQTANQKLQTVAGNRNVELPSDVMPKHKQLMQRLQKMEGAAFDKAYTQAMVKEHRADIAKYQKQAKNAMDTDVREYAESTLPSLQKHLEHAQQTTTSMRSSNR